MLKRFAPYYRFLRPLKRPVACAIATGFLAAATNGFGFPYVVKFVLPKIFPEDGAGGEVDQSMLLLYVLLLPLIFFVRGAAAFGHTYLIGYVGVKVVEQVRTLVFERVLHLPLAFFQEIKSGDLYSRVMGDSNAIKGVVVDSSAEFIRLPLTWISAIGFVVYYCLTTPHMAIFLLWLGGVPLLLFPIAYVGRKIKQRSRQLQERTAEVSSNLIEAVQTPREIRAFGYEQPVLEGFQTRIADVIRAQLKVMKYNGLIGPFIEIVSAIGVCGAMYYAGVRNMTLTSLLPLLVALHIAYEPMRKLAVLYNRLKTAGVSLDRIEYILHYPDRVPEHDSPVAAKSFETDIIFDHVTFSYDGQFQALRDVSVTVKKGEVVALVGPSGAGKSTFTNLLPRFYDPVQGEIRLDGIPLPRYGKHSLRGLMSMVSQDPILFNETVMNNILVGRPGAGADEVVRAARSAHAHDFIGELDSGYDTLVGERGTRLSGGQKQRIAIARAFLRNAPILILDEATSALDSETESHVQQALAELVKGKTVFIIAHRFSTTRVANRVIVFEEGRIIADGPHEAVYRDCPRYRILYDFQTTLRH